MLEPTLKSSFNHVWIRRRKRSCKKGFDLDIQSRAIKIKEIFSTNSDRNKMLFVAKIITD